MADNGNGRRSAELCDLGFQCPELGYVSLSELENIRLFGALGVERDRHFTAEFPLSIYAQAARIHSQITFEEKALLQAKAGLESEKRRSRNWPPHPLKRKLNDPL